MGELPDRVQLIPAVRGLLAVLDPRSDHSHSPATGGFRDMTGITGHQLEHETPPLLRDVLCVEQLLLARIEFKLNVEVAVLFGLDLADNTRCGFAGIEELEASAVIRTVKDGTLL
jgi:hypothetical protein